VERAPRQGSTAVWAGQRIMFIAIVGVVHFYEHMIILKVLSILPIVGGVAFGALAALASRLYLFSKQNCQSNIFNQEG